ncbi:hypothetical protein Cgig2_016008 [Carnegiea gigantea]|uniref:WD repeat-containing protein 44 n=1 Tax=Carnegiea gigantea TaxID=171969 RepID=A0A9Q1KPA5_9CARY|nr:hypothetical protein Cgig2_016008 [Carnegiea gigantea]
MDTCSDNGEHQFFDAVEEIAVASDSGSDCPEEMVANSSSREQNLISNGALFDVWIQNPESVQARRSKFLNWLGLGEHRISSDDPEDSCDFEGEFVRISSSESASRSLSYWSTIDSEFSGKMNPEEKLVCRIDKIDGGMESNVGDQTKELVSDISITDEHPECSSGASSFNGTFALVKSTDVSCSSETTKSVKKWWLRRLRSFSCVAEKREESFNCGLSNRARIQRVKVHQSKKQSKELSALYLAQNIRAHKGAILTMEFSPDGQLLASAGEDRIVRVWKVVEDDRSSEFDIPDMDPSCVYFAMNHQSELKPLTTDKEKNGKLRRTSDSACVILPPKVFRLLEKPLHEFQGHTCEVLDLSWSKNNCLLSSSVDKTVRLWRVGSDRCLKFNPVNDNHFISGSIDGKVRIWEISHCKVVNWTEIKDIVTAVCYRPDGQGGIIGTITGSCRFYSISDNQLQLDAQISLHNKKKSSGKWITGFQFFTQDPSKVMVSCADSQVRIIKGVNVIGKYKGLKSAGTYCSAYFTSDGKHIVSASEDSNVYVWKCNDQDHQDKPQIKKIKSSERFLSNASIALPWPGLRNEGRGNRKQTLSSFSPADFSCGHDFLDSCPPKGSALWPEERLLSSNPMGVTSSIHKSEFKFLRSCQSISDFHAWGLVIVTAGWDGRIKSFHNYGLPVPH